jgi:hypothetical protein
VHVTVLALVFGAAILLTWMLVHSYSRREVSPVRRRAQRANAGNRDDAFWMFSGGDSDASDCSGSDAGGCGDGGGGGD